MKGQYVPNKDKCVVSVTSLCSGSVWNVYPDDSLLKGTLRYFSDENLKMMIERIRKVINHISEMHEVTAELVLMH